MKNSTIRPHITEKTMNLAQTGCFTFAVDSKAEKPFIAAFISKHYGVSVEDVHTVHMHGKVRRVGKRRTELAKSDWKKAIVRLKKGQTIEAFQPPKDQPEKK